MHPSMLMRDTDLARQVVVRLDCDGAFAGSHGRGYACEICWDLCGKVEVSALDLGLEVVLRVFLRVWELVFSRRSGVAR